MNPEDKQVVSCLLGFPIACFVGAWIGGSIRTYGGAGPAMGGMGDWIVNMAAGGAIAMLAWGVLCSIYLLRERARRRRR